MIIFCLLWTLFALQAFYVRKRQLQKISQVFKYVDFENLKNALNVLRYTAVCLKDNIRLRFLPVWMKNRKTFDICIKTVVFERISYKAAKINADFCDHVTRPSITLSFKRISTINFAQALQVWIATPKLKCCICIRLFLIDEIGFIFPFWTNFDAKLYLWNVRWMLNCQLNLIIIRLDSIVRYNSENFLLLETISGYEKVAKNFLPFGIKINALQSSAWSVLNIIRIIA